MAKLYWLGAVLILIAITYQYRKEIRTLLDIAEPSSSSKSPKRESSKRAETSTTGQKKTESNEKTAAKTDQEKKDEKASSSAATPDYYNPPFDPDNPPEPRYSKSGTRLITKNELAAHGHSGPLKPIWLAIMGRVYDVDKGAEHYYGPNGGYKFFTGKFISFWRWLIEQCTLFFGATWLSQLMSILVL